MITRLLPNVAVVLLAVGCACRQQPASSAEERPAAGPEIASPQDPPPGVREPANGSIDSDAAPSIKTFNTGDSEVWPSYGLPLLFKVDVPEVPEGLSKPSPPILSLSSPTDGSASGEFASFSQFSSGALLFCNVSLLRSFFILWPANGPQGARPA